MKRDGDLHLNAPGPGAWERVPDQLTLARALRYARQSHGPTSR